MINKITNKSINPSFRETPRYTNYSTIEHSNVFGNIPLSSKNSKPNEFLFTKTGRFRKGIHNFKNMQKFKMVQRRTATNSPNYNDLS